MIQKIILENFMAHEETEIVLGPGVTALTGPNNTGKSAVVEALRCVATNPKPRHHIRHGAKEARVSVEFEDGTRIVWIRKKRSSGYELWPPGAEEPEEYWKFGRKPPEDILKVLRLDIVGLEGDKEIDVHIGNQRDPVFLLNRPDSDAAAFFAASTESAHLLAMQNVLKRRTQDAKRQEREFEGRLGEIQGEMDAISPLPDIAFALEMGRELESSMNCLQSEIPVLEKHLLVQRQTVSTLAGRQATAMIFKDVAEPPKTNIVDGLDSLIDQIHQVDSHREMAGKIDTSLAPLTAPPVAFDTVRLATLCDRLQYLDKMAHRAGLKEQSMASLQAPIHPEETVQLSELIDKLQAFGSLEERLKHSKSVLQNIVEPPQVVPDKHLESLLADIRGFDDGVQVVKGRIASLETELQSVKDAIAQVVDDLGCCPTCGADLNTEAFLDRGCLHDA